MPRRRPRKPGFDLDGLTELAGRELENFMRGNAAHHDLEISKLYRARSDAAKMGLSLVDALRRFAESMPADDTETSHAIVARARAALAQPEAPQNDDHEDE
jgi:hypothetical protein